MADWQKIKTEYITTDTSYRELSQKYGVHYTNIAKKAKKEDWQQLRQQQANTTQTRMIEVVEQEKVDRVARLMTVSDKLLNKVEQLVDQEGPISAGAIKNLSDALKNIRDAQMLKHDKDLQEQDARIAKLQKEAQKEEQNHDVTIVIEGGEGAWQS